MSNQGNNDKKQDVIIWSVVIITGIIAFFVGQKIGMRGRIVFYFLIFIEIIMYLLIRWILRKLK